MILLEGVTVTTLAATLPGECHISLVPGVLCAGRGRGRGSRVVMVSCGEAAVPRRGVTGRGLELETKVHPKIRNHGEGPY